jgi:anti-sigma factor ChrR (cupin superfamily)
MRRNREPIMRKYLLTFAFLLASGAASLAQGASKPVNSGDLKWGPAPNVLPPGAKVAVISGDPFKNDLYVVRLKMPAGYKIPAHQHPTSEFVTVISGKFNIGMGDKLDPRKGMALRAGGFAEAPARMNHYAWTSGPAIVQVHGQGPFAITYVNPADDPSKK